MAMRVLILGGYGNFGSYVARALKDNPAITLIIAGRSLAKAQAFDAALDAVNPAEAAAGVCRFPAIAAADVLCIAPPYAELLGVRRFADQAGTAMAITLLLSAALFPIYWMVITALRPKSVTMVWPPRLLPDLNSLSLSTITTLLQDGPILGWAWNSLLIALMTTVAVVFVSTLAGYALSRAQGGAARGLGTVILVAKMLPSTLLERKLFK